MYKQLRNKYKNISGSIPKSHLKFSLNLQKMSFLLMATFVAALCSLDRPAQGQDALSFSRIAEGGFWEETGEHDPHNSYTWSMAWFKGKLYVGTNRDILALRYIQALNGKPTPPLDPWPVKYTPEDPLWHDDGDGIFEEGEGLDTRAEIWRYTPETAEWEMVHQADWVSVSMGKSINYVGEEYGYRKMLVFDGALYITTAVVTGNGARILRTEDGENFEVVSNWLGLTPGTIVGLRGLVSFNGKLYTTPVGQESFTNAIYESPEELNPANPDEPWKTINLEGFGDPNNKGVFEMCVFNGFLYAATVNPFEGFQIWKTDGVTPDDPDHPDLYKWNKVVTDGAYRGPLNETALSMYPFKGKDGIERLYVGGGILTGGHDFGPIDPITGEPEWEVGPGVAEFIRINPADGWELNSWELICGDSREDPNGNPIEPISGLPAGFADPFTSYFWRMAEHDGWLYVGTADNSTFLWYMPPEELPEEMLAWLSDPEHPEHTVDYIVENTGGFDFWKSEDGVNWYPISWSGFGNHFNMGTRAIVSAPKSETFDGGLFIGTANPFTDEVPAGGCQVWLGTPGALNPPTNLQANFEAHQAKLRWTPSAGTKQYRVIRHTGAEVARHDGKVTIVSPPPPPEFIGMTTEHFYVDTTVEKGKKYVYYIKTDSGTGISDPSNVVGGKAEDIFFQTIPGRFTYNRATRQFVQTLTIINKNPMPLKPQVPIVLEGLTPNVILTNQDGKAENGSPLVYAPSIPGHGGSARIVLRFQNPTFAPIKYIPFVVFGSHKIP